jgi:ATP diphosphatase
VATQSSIERLLDVMARLRDPDGGCPWDLEQDFSSIAPYTIEEAYEVADAIERQDLDDLEGELGDLLLQVVYHAQMAKEAGRFDFETVAARIADKMLRRHPHVFGSDTVESAAAQSLAWEEAKAAERAQKEPAGGDRSILADLPIGLPALTRSTKLQRRAARVGFDWPEIAPVLAKLEEEIAEVRGELAAGGSHERLEDEVGDLLFAAANVARHLGVDGETALRRANAKFERRFRAIERELHAEGRPIERASLDEMEALWQAAKASE